MQKNKDLPSRQIPIFKISMLSFAFAFLDQITKLFALEKLQTPIKIIENFFTLTYSENTGIAFGINIPYSLLLAINIILIGALIYFAVKELDITKRLSILAIALIIGGGLGNLIDRLEYGYVIDFISIWQWPIFNLADAYITAGVLALLLFYAKIKRL